MVELNQMINILDIQNDLEKENLDGWLIYDFRRSNDLACRFLQISSGALLTRRFLYWIPKVGDPIKVVHQIEAGVLDHLPGSVQTYQTWRDFEEALQRILQGSQKVAMEFSPRNAIPTVSKVDGGTIDLVRSFDVEVASSANILQRLTSVWSEAQLQSHLAAANFLDRLAGEVWEFIGRGGDLDEYKVQQFMLNRFQEEGFYSDDAPICAVNANSANPHYSPTKEHNKPIKPDDWILIDLWCKKRDEDAVYADITRVGIWGKEPSEKQQKVFDIVKNAQNNGTELIRRRLMKGETVRGWEVDQVCRCTIVDAGFGPYFVHRTGHNIDTKDHGAGANIDNFETRDERELLPGTCFSIEPGIYLPGEFGVRLEYDVYIYPDNRILVTGGVQEKIHLIPKRVF